MILLFLGCWGISHAIVNLFSYRGDSLFTKLLNAANLALGLTIIITYIKGL